MRDSLVASTIQPIRMGFSTKQNYFVRGILTTTTRVVPLHDQRQTATLNVNTMTTRQLKDSPELKVVATRRPSNLIEEGLYYGHLALSLLRY